MYIAGLTVQAVPLVTTVAPLNSGVMTTHTTSTIPTTVADSRVSASTAYVCV